MQEPSIPPNEVDRVATLHKLGILDTPRDDRFDRYTRISARIFDMPIAVISLVDRHRQWFKSTEGFDATESPRNISFCGHAILGDEVFEVRNALRDPRFRDNPLVTNQPNIRFYALTYKAGVDDPTRFKHSRTVAAHFGLTPRRFQSGEIDIEGHISRCGDRDVRSTLYTAANALMTRSLKWSSLKAWGMQLAKTRGHRRAVIAVARKLAVILHRMWIDETQFQKGSEGARS